MNDVGVVIPVFGDLTKWMPLARRAAASVHGAPVQISIGDTLCEARNNGAAVFDTEYVLFLDADDTLDEHFFDRKDEWTGDIIKPRVLVHGIERQYNINDDIREANYLIVGCPVRRSLFEAQQGFREFPCYEDWELWARLLMLCNATVEERDECIYNYNLGRGRNVSVSADIALTMRSHIRSIR